MLLADLSHIDDTYLSQLCADACPESDSLDFKAMQPAKSEDGKQELLKDVCAFANSFGGDIVFGISDSAGCAKALVPITTETGDALVRRILQVLDAGIDPRVQGIQTRVVNVTGGGFVLVLRVPASLEGPHSFHVNSVARRFVMRNNTLTTDMTMPQIRQAFDRTASLAENARTFLSQRVDRAAHRKTWRPMPPGPLCLAAITPLSAGATRASVDLKKVYDDYGELIYSEWRHGITRTLNADAIVVYPSGMEALPAYTQVFRNGSFEALKFGGSLVHPERRVIPSTVISKFFRESIVKANAFAKKHSISGPALCNCALLHASDYELGIGSEHLGVDKVKLDRDIVVLPEVWIEDIGATFDIDSIARPMLDVLWQAFGVTSCLEYNEEGVWQGPRATA